MKSSKDILNQLINGEIAPIQQMTAWSENKNIIYSNEECDVELIEKQNQLIYLNEILNELIEDQSNSIEEYRIEKEQEKYESSDKEVYLEDFIEFVESKNIYIKSLMKRYEESTNYGKKLNRLYMYEIYECLKNILYSVKRHDDECKFEIIDLIKKLEIEEDKTNVYNIDSKKINSLISELKEVQEFIESIDFEYKYNDPGLFKSADKKIIEIISTYFWDKQRQYRDNRLDKFKKRKERKDKYIKLYTSGYKQCEIAKIMGVTESAVSLYLKRNNIK